MVHKQVRSARGSTHYWVEKHANPKSQTIVFTHGLTADHRMFEKQVAYFRGEYTVIVWDVPLHGLSRPYGEFSYDNAAYELAQILQVEGIQKVVLVGMSMGGYPAQAFIDLYPEMVEGFVALDTTPFGLDYYSKFDLWCLRQAAPMAKWFTHKTMAKSVSRTPYAYEMMMEMLTPLTKTEITEQMDAAYGVFARENRDIEITCPVLILLGEYDQTGKVAQYCRAWSAKTGYPLQVIKGASHFSNGDNPEQVNEEIERFVKGVKS